MDKKDLTTPLRRTIDPLLHMGVRGTEQRLPTTFSKSLFSNLVEIGFQLVTTICGPPTIDH